jgi:hypothetical protein
MKIGDLFEKDINRDVNGVIKVGQLEEGAVRSELEEYILTPEVRKEFNRLFGHYVSAQRDGSDRIGVWISGFFGSGKSHFLKMLSYLLRNDTVVDRTALEWFRPQVKDSSLEANLERASDPPARVILFNIDSEASSDGKSGGMAIVRVFQKMFDTYRGYFGQDAGIARIERNLDAEGQFEAFQTAFETAAGITWLAARDTWDFQTDAIAQALIATRGMTPEGARALIEAKDLHAAVSPR